MFERTPTTTYYDRRKFLKRISREVVAITMGNPVKLLLDRIVHFVVGMANAINGRAAGAIDVNFSVGIMQVAALGPNHFWHVIGGVYAGGQFRMGVHEKSCTCENLWVHAALTLK